MKKEIVISAKKTEEAIEMARIELGAPSVSAMVITIINEGRPGFLGFGAIPATIKAVYQTPDPEPESPIEEESSESPADLAIPTDTAPRSEERRERPERRGNRSDRGNRSSGNRSGDRSARREAPAETAPAAPVLPPVENIDPATATESEQIAYRFICELVENMGLEGVVIAMHPGRNDDMVITVDGDAAGVLIGHHGDTLDALQYLANLAANRKEEGERREYARITVDVESYRAKREEALRILARKKAHQVLRYKKSIMLEPMNPYERRIIHSEIQRIEGVATNSIGVENNRRVVIYLEEEGMPTAGIKGTASKSSGERSGRSRNHRRRRRSADRGGDPLATESLTGEVRVQGESIFSDDEEHDPFDIDLSAATYNGEDEDDTPDTPAED